MTEALIPSKPQPVHNQLKSISAHPHQQSQMSGSQASSVPAHSMAAKNPQIPIQGVPIPQSNIQPLSSHGFSQNFTSVYVGNLDNDVTEADIVAFILTAGVQIGTVKVCRALGKSLQYGYVNFNTPEDAQRAIAAKNCEMLKGKPIRMMECQRDPTIRKSNKGNIFVKGLEPNATPRMLFETLSDIGPVQSVEIKKNPKTNLNDAFIQFAKEEHAQIAIDALQGSEINGSKIEVNLFIPQKEQYISQNMKDDLFVNCYLKNIDQDMIKTEEDLTKLFEDLTGGKVTSSKLVTSNGSLTGAGFVAFLDHESAVKACELASTIKSPAQANNEDFKPMICTRFMRKNERTQVLKEKFDGEGESVSKKPSNNNIFIKNLDPHVNDEMLKNEFLKYGPILSAKVMKSDEGISKGFGFVCFENSEHAAKVVEAAKNQAMTFFNKNLYVAFAMKKSDRLQHLKMIHSNPMNPYFKNNSVNAILAQNAYHQANSMYTATPINSFHHPQFFQMPNRMGQNPNQYQHNYQNTHSMSKQYNPTMRSDQNNQNYSGYNRSQNYLDQNYYRMNQRTRNLNNYQNNQHHSQYGQNRQENQNVKTNIDQQQSHGKISGVLTENEKNEYGQLFIEKMMILAKELPQVKSYQNKIVGMFLMSNDREFCEILKDYECFKTAVVKALDQLNESTEAKNLTNRQRQTPQNIRGA